VKEDLKDLQKAVEGLHNCSAIFKESVPVKDEFDGRRTWEGIVHVFDLIDHPESNKCYAWSSPIEGSEKRKFYAVLHIPPVHSPERAIRASIIKDFRTKK